MSPAAQQALLPPGSTIGILGGGQLGRMAILAGRPLGYRFAIYDPSSNACAAPLADAVFTAAWDDEAALEKFAKSVDAVTFEFENVQAAAANKLAENVPLFPKPSVLEICQNRRTEKEFCVSNDLPCAPFACADTPEQLAEALDTIGYPCVLKTATSGYDGKGQLKLNEPPSDIAATFSELGDSPLVVEKWIQHNGEYSVVCARSATGDTKTFPVPENEHRNHILHRSSLPSGLSAELEQQASDLARQASAAFGVVGLLTTEFFLTKEGQWLINEFAPRPHNSGHYSMDACGTSQFEQLVRAVAGMPLGDPSLLRPSTMINLLGDLWQKGEPDWAMLLAEPQVHLHLYDKGEARKGRKMGHFTVTGDGHKERAEELFEKLSRL